MAATAPTADARPASSTDPGVNRSSRSAHPKTPVNRNSSDDEILGLNTQASNRGAAESANGTASVPSPQGNPRDVAETHDAAGRDSTAASTGTNVATHAAAVAEPEHLRAALDANPELRAAWQDANAYRETFATPEDARAATASLADLDHMDALFFSRRPEDHAELARAVAKLDPAAFASLSQAMTQLAQTAASSLPSPSVQNRQQDAGATQAAAAPAALTPNAQRPQTASHQSQVTSTPTPEQTQFFHATNAATVEGVLAAIESQVARLLPEGVSKTAHNRVVGEIYRELDTTLRSNRALAQQMRDAFRTGALDGDHQNAIVSLVTGRARQALPAVAKRVLNEWTSTVVSANQQRRERQRSAERRVDIAGSGGAANDGRRSLGPRDIDYARLSDADILNL
jgi:hypothetical protein